MEWLQPAGAWALFALVPVLLLYLFRKRTRQTTVPSLLLWRKAETEHVQNRPFLRLQNQLLLWLQLLMVLLLTLALMRPATGGGTPGESVWIFDLSASMQTVDGAGISRLRHAQTEALALLRGMRSGEKLTILTAGQTLGQPLTRSEDRLSARHVIQSLNATNGDGNLPSAIALAEAMQRELVGTQIVVFSDDPALSLTNAAIVGVGQSADNRAIADLTMQSESGTAFARIDNYGRQTEAEIECYADGALCDVRTISLPENAQTSVRFSVPVGTTAVRVRFTNPDALVADDERAAVRPIRTERTALLVTNGNTFLEHALALDQRLAVDLAAYQDRLFTEGYDLYIYDGIVPETLPESGAIFVLNPESEVLGIAPAQSAAIQEPLRAAPGKTATALCENLLLHEIAIKEGRALLGGTPILVSGENALLCTREIGAQRVAVMGFDLHQSNLPLKADFPVLIQNLLRYLLPEPTVTVAKAACGQEVAIETDVRAETAYVLTPTGRKAALVGGKLTDTNEIGWYTLVESYPEGHERETRFVLHVPETESDTRQVAQSDAELETLPAAHGNREWAAWLLLLAFLLALVEWEVSRRGA